MGQQGFYVDGTAPLLLVPMRAVFIACLMLVLVLAGCLGGDRDLAPEDGNGEGSNGAGSGEGLGSVSGEVVTGNLETVLNARIRLIQDDNVAHEAHTDENGKYNITGVQPGEYRIQAFAPHCCETDLRRVHVGPQQDIKMNFMLEIRVPETGSPFMDGLYDSKGWISCSVALPTQSMYPCQPYDDEHKQEAGHVVDMAGLKTLHVAVVWDSPALATGSELTLSVYNNVGGSHLIERKTDASPLEIRIDSSGIEDEDLRFENFYGRDMPLRFAVTPTDIGVLYQQPFTLYWSLHFWEEAPSDFSTVPEY